MNNLVKIVEKELEKNLLTKLMVVAIEPMINMNTHKITQHNDGWTITTKDNLPSAHFEHNVAIINGKPEILSTFKFIYESLGISSDEEDEFHNYF